MIYIIFLLSLCSCAIVEEALILETENIAEELIIDIQKELRRELIRKIYK